MKNKKCTGKYNYEFSGSFLVSQVLPKMAARQEVKMIIPPLPLHSLNQPHLSTTAPALSVPTSFMGVKAVGEK